MPGHDARFRSNFADVAEHACAIARHLPIAQAAHHTLQLATPTGFEPVTPRLGIKKSPLSCYLTARQIVRSTIDFHREHDACHRLPYHGSAQSRATYTQPSDSDAG